MNKYAAQLTRSLAAITRWAFMDNYRPLGLGLIGAGLLAAVGLAALALFGDPAPSQLNVPQSRQTLAVDAIDRLEFWIEEVQLERQTGITFPNRSIFLIEDTVTPEEE